ncbi:MAG: DUF378 domain-containing protein [Halobacteriaceae archaeon]
MEVRDVNLNWLDWLALALVIIGALNWGLTGLGGFANTNANVVDLIFGSIPALENLIYLVVGLAGLYVIYMANEMA